MAGFFCDRCGKCCASFGEFIKIERQLTDRDYYCRYSITNEIFPVHVQPGFAEEIEEEFLGPPPTETDPGKKGCIFKRINPEGKGFSCAIYPTRPAVCREFRCYRMLIRHHASGEIRGKVIGFAELSTHDEDLSAIWKEKIAQLPHPDTRAVPPSHLKVSAPPGTPGHESPAQAHTRNPGFAEESDWVSAVISILAERGYDGDPVE